MKFNWGTGIIIFFIFFAGSMTFAVVATTRYPPQMMQKDYYALDLNYQERLDQKQNTAALALAPTAQFQSGTNIIQVDLPAEMTAVKGSVKCYRSATTRDDVLVKMENQTTVQIPAAELASGRWHIEVEWETGDGKTYFWENIVTVNH